VDLPHTVGLVIDLSPHLVRRALASLSAELRHREHLLARYHAKDLVELERRGEVGAPPSLVIIVDEFAALVQEVPEFVEGVVNVAQRGRSLGLHLVLATQRPAGVIKDNLRANTNLRLALRTADENDSAYVLGSSVAAYFDPARPGRARLQERARAPHALPDGVRRGLDLRQTCSTTDPGRGADVRARPGLGAAGQRV
jgi:S-DNA-T family DNA segregation ATPase FtsK/SpoIIIE